MRSNMAKLKRRQWETAAARYEALKAVADADAIALAVRAIQEALCWLPDGSRMTPEQRGARMAMAGDVIAACQQALDAMSGGAA